MKEWKSMQAMNTPEMSIRQELRLGTHPQTQQSKDGYNQKNSGSKSFQSMKEGKSRKVMNNQKRHIHQEGKLDWLSQM
jgi:hypothetical protein